MYGLNIKHIVICGHFHCGAIEAAIGKESSRHTPALSNWIKENIEPTLKIVKENYEESNSESIINILTQENVLQRQIENLKNTSGDKCVAPAGEI